MTLLEVLVVVAITAMISAIGWPSMRSAAEGGRFNAAAVAVAADLAAARAASIRSGSPVLVEVAADGLSYAWSGSAVRAVGADARLAPASDAPIAFYPDGSSTGGSIAIAADRRGQRVVVDRVTGAVSLAR